MTSTFNNDWPYFIYPAVMELRKGVTDPQEAKRLRRIVAANVGDIPSLRLMLGIDPEDFADFYPDTGLPDLSTNDTIDVFLNRFGQENLPLPEAAAAIPENADVKAGSVENNPDDKNFEEVTDISEENARILIKKHDYQGALEIIQQLSLNIPEKSIYFADQIRFLKKIILNEARKPTSKTV